MAAVAAESTERKNADTAATTALGIERSQREAADTYLTGWFNGELIRLNEVDTYLTTRADSTNAALSAMNVDHLGRFTWLEGYTNSQIASTNQQIADISTQQIPNLGVSLANETARAQQVESQLQQQISSLLSNADGVALNSLAELVADYSANGSGVNTALQAALARIDQLEQTVAALQNTGGGYGSGTPPVE